jgi:hypothetical protein
MPTTVEAKAHEFEVVYISLGGNDSGERLRVQFR